MKSPRAFLRGIVVGLACVAPAANALAGPSYAADELRLPAPRTSGAAFGSEGGRALAQGLQARARQRWEELSCELGLPLAVAPRAAFASAEELGAVLRRNRLHFSACEAAKLAALEELATPEGCAASARLGARVIAAYAIGEDRILVATDFASAASRLLRLYPGELASDDRGAQEALLDVVLWHELAHAVQDRTHDLQKLGAAARGYEARAALSAVIEGHAQHCAERLARSATHRAAFEVLARSHAELPSGAVSTSARSLAACEASFAYRSGLEFFRALTSETTSAELFARAFHEPPLTLWHVENPQGWMRRELDPGAVLEAPLRRFAGELFERELWASALENTTRESLRRALGALDAEHVDRLVSAVQGSRVLQVRERAGEERLVFAVLDLGAPERAAAFVAAELEASRRFDAERQDEPALALRTRYARGDDGALWIEKRHGERAEEIERCGLLLATAGPLVLELNVFGRTSELRARELASALALRLR